MRLSGLLSWTVLLSASHVAAFAAVKKDCLDAPPAMVKSAAAELGLAIEDCAEVLQEDLCGFEEAALGCCATCEEVDRSSRGVATSCG